MKRRQTVCMKRHAFVKPPNLQEQKIEEIKKHQLDLSHNSNNSVKLIRKKNEITFFKCHIK